MRFETGDGWELRCGDCLDPETGLASLESVDHVITDPPYSEGLYSRTRTTAGNVGGVIVRSTGGRAGRMSGNMDAAIALADGRIGSIDGMCSPLSAEWARVVRRWVLVWHDDDALGMWRPALEAAGMSRVRTCVWLKPDPMPQFSGDRPAQDVEWLTIYHQKGRKRWNLGGRGASLVHARCKGSERPDHPSPKPLGLMSWYVSAFTDPGELICDPFAGSGTTGVACIRLGRRFIGWEKDPEFFETAVKRLRKTRRQYTLFEASDPGKQEGLF